MSHAKAIVIVYFCIFASLFVFITPVFEAPDEIHHLDYINYVAATRSLLNQLIKGKSVYYEGHQHPLYYLLAGGIVRLTAPAHKVRINWIPNKRNQNIKFANMPAYVNITDRIFKIRGDMWLFYTIRLLSVALTAINLLFIWLIGGLFFKNEKLALVPVAFAATLPQFFIHIRGYK